jgi:hypothetical protein
MDPNKLFSTLGGIAGLAGIALGVFLLIYQGVLQTRILPGNGLDSTAAYHVIMALLVLTFGLAAVGVVGWLMFTAQPKGVALPLPNIYVLVILLLAVLTSTCFLGTQALDRTAGTPALPPLTTSSSTPTPQPSATATPTPTASPTASDAVGGAQAITRSIRVCTGEYERACDPHDAYLYCNVDLNAWAKGLCEKFKITQLNSRGGNKCGYSLYEVLCTSTVK